MRNLLFLLMLLGSLNLKAQTNYKTLQIIDDVEIAWDQLWNASNQFYTLETTEYNELVMYESSTNAYMNERKKLLKKLEQVKKRIDVESAGLIIEHYKDTLYKKIESGVSDDEILKYATLYLSLLPKRDVPQRVNVYTKILLPIYVKLEDLKEIHYIGKYLYNEGCKNKNNILLEASQKAFDKYLSLKAAKFVAKDDITGLWMSLGDKKSPLYMLNIQNLTDTTHIAILNPYGAINFPSTRFVSMLKYDTNEHLKLHFTHTQFKQGMSAEAVASAGNMVNDISQSVVRNVNKIPDLSAGAQIGTSVGATLFSGLMMMALSNSSVNVKTNILIDMDIEPTDDSNLLRAKIKKTKEQYKSNVSYPNVTVERKSLFLRRVYPDDEPFFVKGRKCMVIGDASRLAFLHREYYNIYKNYNRHRVSHRAIKYTPWFILASFGSIPYLVSDHSRYNNLVYKRIKRYYENK